MHEIQRWRAACAIILAAIAATAAGAADDGKLPLAKVAGVMKASLRAQCNGYEFAQAADAGASAASPSEAEVERAMAREDTAVACDCMPQAVDAYVAAGGGSTMVAPADAVAGFRGAMATCTARSVRYGMQTVCAAGLDPLSKPGAAPIPAERQRARCACLQAGVARLTDQQIADASALAHKDDVARAEALAEGASDPAPTPDPMRELEQRCSAEDAAR